MRWPCDGLFFGGYTLPQALRPLFPSLFRRNPEKSLHHAVIPLCKHIGRIAAPGVLEFLVFCEDFIQYIGIFLFFAFSDCAELFFPNKIPPSRE